jgi:hypothetical protein
MRLEQHITTNTKQHNKTALSLADTLELIAIKEELELKGLEPRISEQLDEFIIRRGYDESAEEVAA